MRFQALRLSFVFSMTAGLLASSCSPGDGADAGPDCMDMCDGNTAMLCNDEGEHVDTDCTEEFSSCIEIDGVVGCAAAQGESCLESFLALCEGDSAGCIDDGGEAGAICKENVDACTASDVRSCTGEVLLADCLAAQPYTVNCEGYGAACVEDEGCVSSKDGYCDDIDFFCDDGLTCTDFVCE
ncbi:MAG: hypothetical protein ACO3JL_00255 [Myxococcota bacterium]